MFNTSSCELNQPIKHDSHTHNISLQGFTKLLLLHVWKLSQSKNFQHAQKLKQNYTYKVEPMFIHTQKVI